MELTFKKILEDNQINFEYQPKIFGKPDFFVKPNIVIFCDSSFWHGRNWEKLKKQLKKGYWQEHISANVKRDIIVNKTLEKEGYAVLRFWDDEIVKHPKEIIEKIGKIQSKE